MKTISVSASKPYNVMIGTGIFEKAGHTIRQVSRGKTAAIVTDDTVDTLYGKKMEDTLVGNGYRVVKYVFPHGESSKNTNTLLSLVNFLAEEKLDRTDVVVALGGGVTGDIAGFAAACYKRGTGFVQVPTTLLAAVDSSVGGKTAVNLEEGKNLFGTFYQPDLVLCDISLLSTLTAEVFRDGCAEVIKYGIISNCGLFNSLKTPINVQLENIIARCVEIKRDIVTEDELEQNTRKLLNFGHTIGHAIEILSKYNVSHGQAIATGMAIETGISYKMGLCDKNCLNDVFDMLHLYNLPVTTSYNPTEIAIACLSDKKRDGDDLTIVLPVEAGKCILKEIPLSELEGLIQAGLETNV